MLLCRGKVGDALKGAGGLCQHVSTAATDWDRRTGWGPCPRTTLLWALSCQPWSGPPSQTRGPRGNISRFSQDISNCFIEYEDILPQQHSVGTHRRKLCRPTCSASRDLDDNRMAGHGSWARTTSLKGAESTGALPRGRARVSGSCKLCDALPSSRKSQFLAFDPRTPLSAWGPGRVTTHPRLPSTQGLSGIRDFGF